MPVDYGTAGVQAEREVRRCITTRMNVEETQGTKGATEVQDEDLAVWNQGEHEEDAMIVEQIVQVLDQKTLKREQLPLLEPVDDEKSYDTQDDMTVKAGQEKSWICTCSCRQCFGSILEIPKGRTRCVCQHCPWSDQCGFLAMEGKQLCARCTGELQRGGNQPPAPTPIGAYGSWWSSDRSRQLGPSDVQAVRGQNRRSEGALPPQNDRRDEHGDDVDISRFRSAVDLLMYTAKDQFEIQQATPVVVRACIMQLPAMLNQRRLKRIVRYLRERGSMAAAHVVPDMLETCVDSGWAIALHCDSRATQQNMERIGLLLVEHLVCLADIYWVKGLNPRRMDGVCPNVYPHWMASYCRLRVAATTGARDRYRRGCVRECSDTRECGDTRGTTECEQQRAKGEQRRERRVCLVWRVGVWYQPAPGACSNQRRLRE